MLDAYSRNARLKPALLTVLPILLTILARQPDAYKGWGAFWSLFVATGGTILLAQLGRDFGKRKEPTLFKVLGGRPTERLLSHASASNQMILRRRHQRLSQLMPDVALPTREQEEQNPSAAREVYEVYTNFLINKTRDTVKFRLIFQENCNYGFRRNLWGLKPVGVLVSTVCSLIVGVRLYTQFQVTGTVAPLVLGLEAVNICFLGVWLAVVRPTWVKIPAEAYAERLLESIDGL